MGTVKKPPSQRVAIRRAVVREREVSTGNGLSGERSSEDEGGDGQRGWSTGSG